MPSAQDFAERLREQAYRTLLPQIQELEQELKSINSNYLAGFEQISRKLESLRQIELPTAESILGEILEEVVRRKDLQNKSILLFMRGLRQKETQEEILSFLLDSISEFCPRVALFAIRGGRFVGWSSRGFSEEAAQNISVCSFACTEYPHLQEALEEENSTGISDFAENSPLQFLRGDVSASWSILPLRTMQRPVAVLLTGGVSEKSDAPAIMAGLVALRLENIALRILRELTVEKPSAATPPIVKKAAMDTKPSTIPAPLPTVSAEEPAPLPEPPAEPASASVSDLDLESIQKLAHDAEAISIKEEAVEEAQAAPPVPPVEQEEAPELVPLPEALIDKPLEERPVPEEEKLHTDAKRFARLLVSEIKLYNEHHVVEGRINRDLYLRLKRDIDRSREMYEKRISPVVSQRIDYFHDEIIRILGDNDPSTLGSDYPGPRVES